MSFSSKLFSGVMLTAFLAAAPLAAQAGQLIEGCHPKAKIEELLKAQDQKPLVVADDFTATTLNKKVAVAAFITSNAGGNLGYFLTSDQPLSGQGTQLCVKGAFTDIKMYSSSLGEPPTAAYVGGAYDDALKNGYKKGRRLLIQATPIEEKNGKVVGKLADVHFISDPAKIGALVLIDRATGGSDVTANFEKVQVTPYGELMQGKQAPPVQMATATEPTMAASSVEMPTP